MERGVLALCLLSQAPHWPTITSPCSVGQSKLHGLFLSPESGAGAEQPTNSERTWLCDVAQGMYGRCLSELDLKGPQGATGRSVFRSGWGEWWQARRGQCMVCEDFGQLRIPGVDVRDTDKCGEGVLRLLPERSYRICIHHTVQVWLALILGLSPILFLMFASKT